MLDFLRKHSQSFFVWLLVGAIAFIFVVQFGPQSKGCGGSLATDYVGKVYGSVITADAWRWAWVMHNGNSVAAKEAKAMKLRETVVDGLIERELLCRAAREAGLTVDDEDVEDSLLANKLFMTTSVHAIGGSSSGSIPIDFTKDDGSFDFETFRMFVNNRFRMTFTSFKQQQTQEMLAQRMRQLFEASVRISEKEVWAEYVTESDRLKIGYVTFDPAFFVRRLYPTDAEVAAWVEQHLAEVEKQYEDDSYKYRNVEKQVRTSHILVKVEPGAEEPVVAERKALAEDVLKRVRAGEDFAKLAAQYSDDQGSAKSGGDVGYKARGQLVEEYEDEAFGMKVGEVSDLVKTQFGFHIIRCDGFREGDIPFEDVKVEIGRTMMRLATARQQAQADGDAFLAKVKAGATFEEAAKALEAVYYPPEPEASAPAPAATAPEAGDAGDEAAEEDVQADEEPRDPLMPRYKESGWIQHSAESIPGIGKDQDLLSKLFALDEESPLIGELVKIGDRLHVITLIEREEPSSDDFATKAPDLRRYLEGEKKISIFTHWVDDLRATAEKEGAIEINQSYLKYGTEEDEGAGEEEPEPGKSGDGEKAD